MTRLSLWGVNPAGYLAGLGLSLVCPDAALTWRARDGYAETALTPEALGAAVLDDARTCDIAAAMARAWLEVADAVARCKPDTGETGEYEDVRGPGAPRERARRKAEFVWWSAAMANPRCGLDLTSGQQDFASIGRTLAESMTVDDIDDMIATSDVPSEPYGRPLSGAHLRISHTDARPYAYQAAAPGASTPRVRVAASWLAWRAITAHPLLGHRHATAPHVVPSDRRALEWSLPSLPRFTLRSRIDVDRYGYGSLSPAEFVVAR